MKGEVPNAAAWLKVGWQWPEAHLWSRAHTDSGYRFIIDTYAVRFHYASLRLVWAGVDMRIHSALMSPVVTTALNTIGGPLRVVTTIRDFDHARQYRLKVKQAEVRVWRIHSLTVVLFDARNSERAYESWQLATREYQSVDAELFQPRNEGASPRAEGQGLLANLLGLHDQVEKQIDVPYRTTSHFEDLIEAVPDSDYGSGVVDAG